MLVWKFLKPIKLFGLLATVGGFGWCCAKKGPNILVVANEMASVQMSRTGRRLRRIFVALLSTYNLGEITGFTPYFVLISPFWAALGRVTTRSDQPRFFHKKCAHDVIFITQHRVRMLLSYESIFSQTKRTIIFQHGQDGKICCDISFISKMELLKAKLVSLRSPGSSSGLRSLGKNVQTLPCSFLFNSVFPFRNPLTSQLCEKERWVITCVCTLVEMQWCGGKPFFFVSYQTLLTHWKFSVGTFHLSADLTLLYRTKHFSKKVAILQQDAELGRKSSSWKFGTRIYEV